MAKQNEEKKPQEQGSNITSIQGGKEAPKEPKADKDEIIKKQQEMIDKLLEVSEDQQKRIERIEYAAEKSRLQKYDDKSKKEFSPVINVRRYAISQERDGETYLDEKTVVAWKLTYDEVEKVNGIWREDQRLTLYFKDGTKADNIPLVNFEKKYKLVQAEIKAKKEDETGVTYTVFIPETDEKLNINAKYVN